MKTWRFFLDAAKRNLKDEAVRIANGSTLTLLSFAVGRYPA
jgi:hypothetical protein